MRIGAVELANPVVAAPMAGVSDKAYRVLAREAGCGLVCTEMVSDQALLYGNPKTSAMLDLAGEEAPLSVQIFGSNPAYMAAAAEIAVSRGAALLDINMGCPTPKIVRNGEGAALMRDPANAAALVRAVVRRVQVPVTVKMRRGWDENSLNATELARHLEAEGVAGFTLHGRTRAQFFSGKADWASIAELKQAVKVPVIGNGDIWRPEDAALMMAQTGCDGVMIGRAALGNPWIFTRVKRYLSDGLLSPEATAAERLPVALRHLSLLVENKGEKVAVREMRKHAAWYTKGVRNAARAREQVNQAASAAQLAEILSLCLGFSIEEY